jgi:hypothetical protein
MSNQASTPRNSDDELNRQADLLDDDAREAAMMRDVLRTQERHREGGIEPELAGTEEDPEPDA